MDDTKPIKRLLNASLIVHIIFIIAEFIIYFNQRLFWGLLGINQWMADEIDDIEIITYSRTIIDLVVFAVLFVIIYLFMRRALSPERTIAAAGVIGAVYAVLFPITLRMMHAADIKNFAVPYPNAATLASHSQILSFVSTVGYFENIANGLMMMAFAMLWYKKRYGEISNNQ